MKNSIFHKGSFLRDTFEQLAELGKLPVRKNSQSVKPTQLEQGHTKKSNYTPLDPHILESHYKKADDQQTEETRRNLRHYFDLQKSEEKKVVESLKQKEEERMKMIEEEEAQKKKKKEEEKKQDAPLPKGKERRNIFSPKKVAKRSQVESRAGSGKQ